MDEKRRERLEDDFEAFRDACSDLCVLRQTQIRLFENDEETKELLRGVAAWFFDDLHKWLIELVIIRAARLMDPAESHGRCNLTADYLVKELEELGLLNKAIHDAKSKIDAYRPHILGSRNKLVAHSDLSAIRSGTRFGEHTKEEADRFFFCNLNEFTDAIGIVLGVGPLDYRNTPGPGDVDSFLRFIRDHSEPKLNAQQH